MKVKEFIEEYLSQCYDTVVCLHSPDGHSSTTFSIYDWRNNCFDAPISDLYFFECEVSQITGRVENFHGGLNVVIHIYTDSGCEEAM